MTSLPTTQFADGTALEDRAAADVAADLGITPKTVNAWCRSWHGYCTGRRYLSPTDVLVARTWLAITGGKACNKPTTVLLRSMAEAAIRESPCRWLVLAAHTNYAAAFDHHHEAVIDVVHRIPDAPMLIDLQPDAEEDDR